MAKRWKAIFEQHIAQTAGKNDELCKRATSLTLQLELLDAAAMRGEPVDPDLVIRLSGAIQRVRAQIEEKAPTLAELREFDRKKRKPVSARAAASASAHDFSTPEEVARHHDLVAPKRPREARVPAIAIPEPATPEPERVPTVPEPKTAPDPDALNAPGSIAEFMRRNQ